MDKKQSMLEMGKRIRARREAFGMSQQELAEHVGYKSRSSINKIELGKNDIVQSTIKRIAFVLDCSPAYLMDGVETSDTPPSNIIPMPEMRKVPLIGSIACGTPILAQENLDGEVDIPAEIHADFALRCKGDSMINARIYDGDIVYIRQQEEVEHGEIAAVLVGEEATLKRVYLFDDHISLEAENPQYRPMVYWGEDMNSVRILGKAVAFTSAVR